MTQPADPIVHAYWQSFLDSLPDDIMAAPTSYQAWGFGDSPKMADDLGRLVKEGIKTATASLVWGYDAEAEPYPTIGDYSVILDGTGQPLCIIQTTSLYVSPFDEVDEEQAYLEGEGDRSLAYWRDVHWNFFSRECAQIGREPSEHMPVLCERFKLVFP